MKVNQNNAILVEQVVLKFVQELKLQIMSLVYARNPQTLDAAISMAKNVKRGLVMANESKQVYALKDQIVQLSKQVYALKDQIVQLSKQINALARGGP